jgi:hypothetical protein
MSSEGKEPDEKQPEKHPDIIESLAKHFPKETGELLTAAKEVLLTWTGSKPEQVKADLQIQSRVTLGFMFLMALVVATAGFLAYEKILSGETVAFIFGTAFGSMVTFLYKFLMGTDE